MKNPQQPTDTQPATGDRTEPSAGNPRPDAAPPGDVNDGIDPPPGTKVLLIEDDPTIRMLLQMGLRRHQYDCVAAENGRAAQALLKSHRPDMIVVDLMMPVMDGLAFIQWLRHTVRDDATPVLVFTTVQDPKVMHEVLRTGADLFCGKPMHLKELVAQLRKLNALPRRKARAPAA